MSIPHDSVNRFLYREAYTPLDLFEDVRLLWIHLTSGRNLSTNLKLLPLFGVVAMTVIIFAIMAKFIQYEVILQVKKVLLQKKKQNTLWKILFM